MSYSPFFPKAESLPAKLPIFPLENAVVMPQAELPLNIFEPRYLNLVRDVLASHHMIGMVQPHPGREGAGTPVYRTGCAGRITSYSELRDGRILLSLTGVCRFDIGEELPQENGYRVVIPQWRRFLGDLDTGAADEGVERDEVLGLLKRFFKHKRLDTDWSLIERLNTLELVHAMTILMPLEPAEKQSILESEALSERTSALRSALEFGLRSGGGKVRH